jgi:hypothetical protein
MRDMAKHPQPSPASVMLREKLKELEAQLTQHAADLERLAQRVGDPNGLLSQPVSPAESEAISLAIVYANANVALSITGSIEPDRN